MTIITEGYVGIDVSKDKLDVAVLGQKQVTQTANTKKGVAKLVKEMRELNPKLIVVEATGGYEEALVLGLFEAGKTVRQSERIAGQDRWDRCAHPGRLWEENAAAVICGEE